MQEFLSPPCVEGNLNWDSEDSNFVSAAQQIISHSTLSVHGEDEAGGSSLQPASFPIGFLEKPAEKIANGITWLQGNWQSILQIDC